MKPTILVIPRLPERVADAVRQHYEILGPVPPGTALPEGAQEARVLVTIGSLKTDAALMDALPSLGLIACYGTGYEGVDRAAAAARGIVVTNAGDANAATVAEFAMGLVLATARSIVASDRYVRAGRWKGHAVERMPSVPGLAGRRIGIYGLGAIGSRVAMRAAAFDMEVGYHNRSARTDVPYAYFPSLPELARWADVLVVSVRASAENRHAIDAGVLAALGPRGYIVNISRGLAIDEEALCDALERRVIAGAGLDVFEHEPNVPERLQALDNVVLTPHVAANADSALDGQSTVLIDNLRAWFGGGELRNRVALPAAQT